MNEEYIDWKSRALAAEAETLNLKNLCAHHGICTAWGNIIPTTTLNLLPPVIATHLSGMSLLSI